MRLCFMIFIYAVLLFIIFVEGETDTPRFLSRPRTSTDFVRILVHSLEFTLVTWFFVGSYIVGFYNGDKAAQITVLLAIGLACTAATTKRIDPRFAGTAYRISAVFGLLDLPYMFLMT